jgi:hypothetical protein
MSRLVDAPFSTMSEKRNPRQMADADAMKYVAVMSRLRHVQAAG